ncbi:MAG: cobalamin-dependent protein, partial [Bacteroidia bacterium]|nr:cobalamin-dependent protein [Bacteroidia bacterium]
VLACNNYEIIDLGVMVPPEKIISEAKKHKVDIIGLSGLITPSLEEMVILAKEMQRQKFKLPLLIGGATTSRAHTAVKIDPHYENAVVHVNDASRAVNIVSDLLNQKKSRTFVDELKNNYSEFRTKFLERQVTKTYIPIEKARSNKYKVDWKTTAIVKPKQLGIHQFDDFDLSILVDYIDWSPFFRSWDLFGKYPQILTDDIVGEQATELFNDAQEMLSELVSKKLLKAKAVFGLFKANTINDDDIEVMHLNGQADLESSDAIKHVTFRTLRQQAKKAEGKPNYALADFIAPKEENIEDYMGAFCVCTGFGTEELASEYEKNLDDYNSIMVKALSDRLAEALAEYLHQTVRKEYWCYDQGESLTNEELIKEKYNGIRPAPGYPACPDHLEKETIWQLLDVENRIGVKLTESLAMWPAASVSGYYFANEKARYFGVGKIKEDQLIDFAKRKNISINKARKWLITNLAD